jgi:hypothetical protein
MDEKTTINAPSWYVTLTKMRKVHWGCKWLWAVYFPSIKIPAFDGWFPALDVNIVNFTAEKQTFSAGIGSFSILKNYGERTINITYADDDKRSIANELYKWKVEAFDASTGGVATIEEYSREIYVYYYDRTLASSNWKTGVYLVAPFGEVKFEGGSEGEIVTDTIELSITGVKKDIYGGTLYR